MELNVQNDIKLLDPIYYNLIRYIVLLLYSSTFSGHDDLMGAGGDKYLYPLSIAISSFTHMLRLTSPLFFVP